LCELPKVTHVSNSTRGENEGDDRFDFIVGTIEDILIGTVSRPSSGADFSADPEFSQRQTTFMQRHCMTFENTEENKLEYMDIFRKYVRVLWYWTDFHIQVQTEGVEQYLQRKLRERIPDFTYEEFGRLLACVYLEVL
jgi:hypothetical protein